MLEAAKSLRERQSFQDPGKEDKTQGENNLVRAGGLNYGSFCFVLAWKIFLSL